MAPANFESYLVNLKGLAPPKLQKAKELQGKRHPPKETQHMSGGFWKRGLLSGEGCWSDVTPDPNLPSAFHIHIQVAAWETRSTSRLVVRAGSKGPYDCGSKHGFHRFTEKEPNRIDVRCFASVDRAERPRLHPAVGPRGSGRLRAGLPRRTTRASDLTGSGLMRRGEDFG